MFKDDNNLNFFSQNLKKFSEDFLNVKNMFFKKLRNLYFFCLKFHDFQTSMLGDTFILQKKRFSEQNNQTRSIGRGWRPAVSRFFSRFFKKSFNILVQKYE